MDLVGRKLGKYEIVEFVGQGGMASVYKAFQPGVERHVAIKVMHPHLVNSADFVERFMREARSAGNLHHPHIMPVIDCDAEAGIHYLVLNYVQGGTLEALLQNGDRLSLEQTLQIITQVGEALNYAHQHGMIHRDIKPANIMFMSDNAEHAILADFGIARLQDEMVQGLTATGALVGTPNYMSPEAAQGEKCDERSDIYSLGVVLYEMVTGRTPYQAETLYSFLMKQANEPLVPPRELNPDVPDELSQVIMQALHKEPDQRFASVADMISALQIATSNHGAASPSNANNEQIPSRSPRNQIPQQRSWLSLALVGGGVLTVAILTVLLLTQLGDQPEQAAPMIETEEVETEQPSSAAATSETAAGAAAVGNEQPADQSQTQREDKTPEASGGAEENNQSAAEGALDVSDESKDSVGTSDASSASTAGEGGTSSTQSAVQTEEQPAAMPVLRRKVGSLQIRTRPEQEAGELKLALQHIPFPASTSLYNLWLVDEQGVQFNIGPLDVVSNSVQITSLLPAAISSPIDRVLISTEPDDGVAADQPATIIMSGTLAGIITSSIESEVTVEGPTGEELLTSLGEQIDIARQHAQFMEGSLTADNLNEARGHAEHIVNILEGESGSMFGDVNKDGEVQNPGDGIGVANYISQIVLLADSLAVANGGNADSDTVANLQEILSNGQENVNDSLKQALQIFAADSAPEATPMAEKLIDMLAQFQPLMEMESGPMAVLADSTLTIGQPAPQQIAHFDITSNFVPLVDTPIGSDISVSPVRPAAGLFRLTFSEANSDEPPDTGYGGDGYAGQYGQPGEVESGSYVVRHFVELLPTVPFAESTNYHGWMTNSAGESAHLGPLRFDGAGFVLEKTAPQYPLADFDQIVITNVESDLASESTDQILGQAVYAGQYAPAVTTLLHKSYVTDAVATSGLLPVALRQLELAIIHTSFMRTGIEQQDLAEAHRHAEHVVNILLGEGGEYFGDLDKDGLPQNPGDGVGVLTYVARLESEIEQALRQAGGRPEERFYAELVHASLTNGLTLLDLSIQKALQIFAADTADEAEPFQRELAILLREALKGSDLDGNGTVDPVLHEGGLAALHSYIALLGELALVEIDNEN